MVHPKPLSFMNVLFKKEKKKGKFVSPLIQQTRIVRKEMYVIKFDQPTKIVAYKQNFANDYMKKYQD